MVTLLALLLAAPGISLDVEPGCACVTAERLSLRLTQAGASVGAGARLQVRVRKGLGAVVVEAQLSGGWRLSREVPSPANECPAVEQMVTLLLVSWTKDRRFQVIEPAAQPAPAPRPSAPPPPKPPPPKPPPPKSSSVRPPERAAQDPSPVAPPVVEAPVAVSLVAPPLIAGDMPSVATPPSAPAAAPGVELIARVGLNGRSPPALLAAGELALTLTWSGVGIRLSGGVSDATRIPLSSGLISSSAAWGSLGIAAALALSERLSFDAAVGARLLVLSVSASGFSQNSSATVLSAGGFAEAGLTFRVVGPLVVGAWGTAAVRPLEERLVVQGVEGGVTVPRWQFGLLAGAGVQWR